MLQVAVVVRYLKLRNYVKPDPRCDSADSQGENKMRVKKAFEGWLFGFFFSYYGFLFLLIVT